MSVDATSIAEHYQQENLIDAIRSAFAESGRSIDNLTVEDLAPVDEFHVGGRAATTRVCELLRIEQGEQLVDLGCGIGGLARYVAARHGAQVTGIDLTPDYVETATVLAASVGLAERTTFHCGSATDTPFADRQFDGATMLHVGMNIADKATLFAEAARIVRPGGRFVIYDIMLGESPSSEPTDAPCAFPVPWATEPAMSHVVAPATYLELLDAAGWEIGAVNDRSEAAKEFFASRRRATADGEAPKLPALGLQLLMGESFGAKIANMGRAIVAGALAPTEILAVRR